MEYITTSMHKAAKRTLWKLLQHSSYFQFSKHKMRAVFNARAKDAKSVLLDTTEQFLTKGQNHLQPFSKVFPRGSPQFLTNIRQNRLLSITPPCYLPSSKSLRQRTAPRSITPIPTSFTCHAISQSQCKILQNCQSSQNDKHSINTQLYEPLK